jgi:hypothetical protein
MSDQRNRDQEGQVSEVGDLDPDDAREPISDTESVPGSPTGDTGEPVGLEEAGPDAVPPGNAESNEYDKD